MIVLTGESGSGKSTIEAELCKLGAKKVISHTSRESRKGEVNGKDYYFTSKDKMEEMINNNELVEHVCYNNNFYGISYEELKNSDVAVVEPQGLEQLRNKGIDICAFYLNVPEEERKKRMLNRGDLIEKVEERLKNDRVAFEGVSNNVDYILTKFETNKETIDFILKMAILHKVSYKGTEGMANLLFNNYPIDNI